MTGGAIPKPGPPAASVGFHPDPTGAEVTERLGESDPTAVEVTEVTARLDGLDDLPVAEHVQTFEAVHRALQDTLAAVDGS